VRADHALGLFGGGVGWLVCVFVVACGVNGVEGWGCVCCVHRGGVRKGLGWVAKGGGGVGCVGGAGRLKMRGEEGCRASRRVHVETDMCA
jgi:hypothetical protein